MIDPFQEDAISLHDAADLCPKRHGKTPHISSLYRWTTTGCRGVVLESVQIGGSRFTSREALVRFFGKLTAASGVPALLPLPEEQELEAVENQLDGEGRRHRIQTRGVQKADSCSQSCMRSPLDGDVPGSGFAPPDTGT